MRNLLLATFTMISLTFFFSCNNERIIVKKCDTNATSNEVYTGEKFTLNLTTKNNTKSFSLTDPDGNGKAQILYKQGDSIYLKYVLYCPEHPDYTTYGNLKGVVSKGSSYSKDDPKKAQGEMTFKGDVQLKKGNLSSGRWYIQTIISGDPIQWNDNTHTLSMPKQVVDASDLRKVNVPLASKWVALTITKDKDKDKNQDKVSASLVCNPLGCIVSFVISSPLYDDLKITKIEMENTLFDDEGSFTFNLPIGNNIPLGVPTWTPKDVTNATNRISLTTKGLILKGGEGPTTSPRIYFWGMPRKSAEQGGGNLTGYIFISNDNSEKGLKTQTIQTKTHIQSGKTYQVSLTLPESDLMITELFHQNPAGYNRSMIELYNPTKHPIDLTKYALVRERTISAIIPKDHGASWGLHRGTKTQKQGSITYYLAGFQPGDQYNIIDESLRQKIYIDPSDQNKAPRMLGGQPVTEAFSYGRDSYDRYRFKTRYAVIAQSGNGYSPYLAPGKTAIVCASTAMKDTNLDPTTALIGNYIKKAVDNGDCQFVIATNNGIHDDGNYQGDTGGGTMDHGRYQVMVLCKYIKTITETTTTTTSYSHLTSTHTREIWRPIDATGPLSYYTASTFHPEIKEQWMIIAQNKDHPNDNVSLGKTALTKYKTKDPDSLYVCDGLTTGDKYSRAENMYDRFQRFSQFFPKTQASITDDRYDLVRKPFALYPTTIWDNNKLDESPWIWNKDSQWMLVQDKMCGASLVSSLGTRTVNPQYIDYDFLRGGKDESEGRELITRNDGKKYYAYYIYPLSYNEKPLDPSKDKGRTGYNDISEEIQH